MAKAPKPKFPSISVHRIGHDSEFFLWDSQREEVVPSFRYYKQASEVESFYPYHKRLKARYRTAGKVDDHVSCQKAKVFRDGLAVEVNIDPVTCRAFMWNDTRLALLAGEPARRPERVKFTSRPYVEFTKELMLTFPADLRELGCMPSLDAYTGQRKHIGVDPERTLFRTSGSHLHMSFLDYGPSWAEYHGDSKRAGVPEECWGPFIQLADILIGVPATYIFADELEAKRRKLYGQAGEFRFQASYGGLEYRALSSRIWNHQAIFSLLLGIWKYVLGSNFSTLAAELDPSTFSDVQQAINEADPDKCLALMPEWSRLMKKRWTKAVQVLSRDADVEDFAASVLPKLRQMHLKGLFPDAGVWSRPFAPDAHNGWNDYQYNWKHQPVDSMEDDYGRPRKRA